MGSRRSWAGRGAGRGRNRRQRRRPGGRGGIHEAVGRPAGCRATSRNCATGRDGAGGENTVGRMSGDAGLQRGACRQGDGASPGRLAEQMTAMDLLEQLGITLPVLAAPMAGGPTSPAMAIAATRAGSLGMLAAGYKTAQAVEEQIKELRSESIPFGVNIFAPNPVPVDADLYRRYAAAIQRDAEQFD